jgi:hypothetical protein
MDGISSGLTGWPERGLFGPSKILSILNEIPSSLFHLFVVELPVRRGLPDGVALRHNCALQPKAPGEERGRAR